MWDLLSEEGHKDMLDTQFLEAINAAMDAVEQQENMHSQALPCLESPWNLRWKKCKICMPACGHALIKKT